jgi:hypothetical protein
MQLQFVQKKIPKCNILHFILLYESKKPRCEIKKKKQTNLIPRSRSFVLIGD